MLIFVEYYKNSYFIDIMVNVPLDVSRENQRSTNTLEVEESADVRNTSNRSFLLSIGYFAFLISFSYPF